MGTFSTHFVVLADGKAPATADRTRSAADPVQRVNARYRVTELQPNCGKSQFVNMSPHRPFSSR